MATATSKLNIIVDVIGDQAARGLSGIKGALLGITAAVGAATAAAYTAKKAWDFTKEGAQLLQTETQFRNVAEASGYFADTLLNEMRTATNGMVSDAELMRSGLNIIELGLADSQDGVVRLATVVSTLGLDMQQVIMTFANDSVMRLDALGLSVEKVTKRAEELKASGFVGDAFDQAVLEGLEERVRTLGDSFDTTAGKIAFLETKFTNLSDKFKSGFAESAGPLFDYIVLEERLMDAVDAGIISMERANEIRRDVVFTNADAADGVRELNAVIEENNALVNYASIEAENWDNNQTDLNIALSMSAGSALNAGYAYQEMSEAMRAGGEYVAQTTEITKEQNQVLGENEVKWSSISTNILGTIDAMNQRLEYLAAGGGLVQQLADEAEKAMDEGKWGVAEEKLRLAEEAAIDVQLEIDALSPEDAAKRLEALGYGPEEATKRVEEMQAALFAIVNRDWYVDVYFRTNQIQMPTNPYTGGGGGGGEFESNKKPDWYASGTNGWQTVPGTIGQPYPAILHGGEKFNVVPNGGSAGGGNTVNWYGDAIFTTAGEAMSFLARMQSNASRNAASAAAGGGYIG